jgi:hypothetical protein
LAAVREPTGCGHCPKTPIIPVDAHWLIYRLPKPRQDGSTELMLTPLDLIDRLVALIPPPRAHRHRYHGVLAPNAPLRPAVTALAQNTENSTTVQTPE